MKIRTSSNGMNMIAEPEPVQYANQVGDPLDWDFNAGFTLRQRIYLRWSMVRLWVYCLLRWTTPTRWLERKFKDGEGDDSMEAGA